MPTTPIYDPSIKFLSRCSSEELAPLQGALEEGGITNDLCEYPEFVKYDGVDRTKYVGAMCRELQLFGGNSIANFFRGGDGVPYSEIVCDVADNLNIKYRECDGVECIEQRILDSVLKNAWERMSNDERENLLSEVVGGSLAVGGMTTSSFVALFRMGGFSSYKISLIVVNAIAKAILGRGLSLAANAGLCKVLSIVTGPVGWVVSGLWTAADIAGPAYRVTIPAVIYIAALRVMKNVQSASLEMKAA